jgi:hypothetical protein
LVIGVARAMMASASSVFVLMSRPPEDVRISHP